MPNPFFQFKQFTVKHDRCAMKVTTDACAFGAWCADVLQRERTTGKRILDIGGGTGLLSLMVAQKTEAIMEAVEIDSEAATQARENFSNSPFAERLTVREADFLQLPPDLKYDIIISNPPFYENELASEKASRNIAHHGHALTVAHLLSHLKSRLQPHGEFFLLLPYKRKQEIEHLLAAKGLYCKEQLWLRQTPAHSPFRLLLRGSPEPAVTFVSELVVADGNRAYTPEFTELLKDYYLRM